jgi:hypothetical protein
MECKLCPYFDRKRHPSNTSAVAGLCKLRNKTISDKTITEVLCKDRATGDVKEPMASEPKLMGETARR